MAALLKLGRQAIRSITAHATRGFETPYKKEVGGHLLGYRAGDGFFISRAIPYNSRYSTRSGWGTIQYYFIKKGHHLETKKLRWIGTYHSHVEIRRSASACQSPEDREAHMCSELPVEIIVRITTRRMRSPERCLNIKEIINGTEYFFDICGYYRNQGNLIIRMPVE